MNLAAFTVRRPVFTLMAVLIAVTLGLISLSRLPIDLMPELTFPTLNISTSYENASPQEVEELITRPVERAVAAVPGVEELSSTSSEGVSSVSIRFTWDTDLDAAANDLRDRLDRILDDLPEDIERPQLRKFDPSAFPILIIGVASDLDPLELRQLIDEQLSYRVERQPGVASVDVWGGLEREIQVRVDPARLAATQVSLDEVRSAIRDANVNVPAGELEEGVSDIRLRIPGRFETLEELRALVVAHRNGRSIYLHQLAVVEDTHEQISRIVRINGKPGVRLAVRKQSGSNTVQVADAVLAEVARINRDFPQLELLPIIDSGKYIRRSIDNLNRSILYGGGLAVFVLLFFLRDWRSTLVAATAIPISVVVTFALIYFGGFSLNLMTLGGLALGVGMMVDNAIVVLENIRRVREEGDASTAAEAAVLGTQQVSAAVIASTLTTLAVFLPMVFMEGVTGQMFRQLAAVVAFALFASLVVAISLVPMLASRLLGSKTLVEPQGGWKARSRGLVSWLEARYQAGLRLAFARWGRALGITFLLFFAALALVPQVGGEFMPATDEGEVRVTFEMGPGTRIDVIDAQVQRIEALVREKVPELEGMVVSIGASSFRPGAGATGEVRASLVPASQRGRSSQEVADALRVALQEIPGGRLRVRPGQGMFLMGTGGGGDRFAIEIRGYELEVLDELAAAVQQAVMQVPGITDLNLSRETGVPERLLRIDRQRAADLGVTPAQIARTLQTAVAGSSAGDFRTGGDEFRILVQLAGARQVSPQELLALTLTTADGRQVTLGSVADFELARGPMQIEREDQQRLVRITGDYSDRDLISVAQDAQAAIDGIPVPRNYDISLGGDYEEQQEASGEIGVSLLLALGLVYMVMASLYESLRNPLVVMLSVPLAIIGVVLALYLTGSTFNVQSGIGVIMLIGIVVNNAILIVDQANRLYRDRGLDARSAVQEAGRRRLRPILMTTLTTVLGLLPLALGIGEGAEAQAPMARAVIGGLLSSTLVTLVVIPLAFAVVHRRPARTGAEVG